MQNYPYATQWMDRKPISNTAQGYKDKDTPDPL